jgi:hypothetical protein
VSLIASKKAQSVAALKAACVAFVAAPTLYHWWAAGFGERGTSAIISPALPTLASSVIHSLAIGIDTVRQGHGSEVMGRRFEPDSDNTA